jgi:hypothetical protein
MVWPKYVPFLDEKDIHRSIIISGDVRSATCWLWCLFGVNTNQFKTVVNRLYKFELDKMHNPNEVGHLTAVMLWEFKVSNAKVAKIFNRVFVDLGYTERVFLKSNYQW